MIKIFVKLIILFFLSIAFSMSYAKNNIISKIEWSAPKAVQERFKFYFTEFKNKNYDPINIKLKIDILNKELVNSGYFDSKLTYEVITTSDENFNLRIVCSLGTRTQFHFSGNTLFSPQELKSKVTEKIKNDLYKIDHDQLIISILEMYEDVGYFNGNVRIHTDQGYDLDKNLIRNLYLDINEGEKLLVTKLNFRGNNIVPTEEIIKKYNENGTALSQSGYYDKKYIETFSNILKKFYLSKGFVYAEISRPRITQEDNVEVEFAINEKNQVIVSTIDLQALDSDLQKELFETLTNKIGKPLNVIELENDFKKITSSIQSKGYYFASIANLNSDGLIKYDRINSSVAIYPEINLDKKVCYSLASISGTVKTNNLVIDRELRLQHGELITPEKLEAIRNRLTSLGLFSNIKLAPYMVYGDEITPGCAKTTLLITVKEKDFGLLEVSPGYRTDLGAKIGTGITYNNLFGMNRSLSFKVQGNQRFNLDGFDVERKTQNKKLFEYSAKISYIEPYLFNDITKTPIEFEASSSWQRKRYTSFDADILRVSPSFTKSFTKNISSSVRYQFERISQYNASDSTNNDNYSIGGITPSVVLDYRNDPINTRSGNYFSLSSEWANPYFGSMKDSSFEVNYVKLIARNKFYFSLGNFVFATSIAGGFEKNYAVGKYIPSIKVFRLEGYDEIRGFDDAEINRIPGGILISDVAVQDSAYFVAFKFEPRYNVNDSVQLDVFFDAGRVFVNKFQPLDLRTSVGAGIKFLTPVGSLDFDYGIKLKKESYSDGTRDGTGRFHISIGFF